MHTLTKIELCVGWSLAILRISNVDFMTHLSTMQVITVCIFAAFNVIAK